MIPATPKPKKVKINGKKVKGMNYDKRSGTLTIPVTIADITQTTIIEIDKW